MAHRVCYATACLCHSLWHTLCHMAHTLTPMSYLWHTLSHTVPTSSHPDTYVIPLAHIVPCGTPTRGTRPLESPHVGAHMHSTDM